MTATLVGMSVEEFAAWPRPVRSVFEAMRADVAARDLEVLADRFRAADARRREAEADLAVIAAEVERSKAFTADGHLNVKGWLRATGRWSNAECTRVVRRARLFASAPETADALLDGALGLDQVDALARARANPRCGEEIVPFVPIFLGLAPKVGYAEFFEAVRYWERFADEDGAFRERTATIERRRARVAVDDGVVRVEAVGGALAGAEMQQIFDRFEQAELLTDRASVGDDQPLPRTADQRRFDALHAIFLAAASAPPGSRRPEPSVHLAVDMGTWMEHLAWRGMVELDPSVVPPDPLSRWCTTSDGVLVHPADVFEAAIVGSTRRIVFDNGGVPIDLGRRSRLFRNGARDATRWNSKRCTHLGCDRPESQCEHDHVEAWADGGGTKPRNGAPACRGHNVLRQHGFRVWRDPDGHWHTYRPDGTEIT